MPKGLFSLGVGFVIVGIIVAVSSLWLGLFFLAIAIFLLVLAFDELGASPENDPLAGNEFRR